VNRKLVEQIVSALLYEGYILYPYRPSVKNRHRWTFGGLVPPAYSQAQAGTDACEMQTQCLVLGRPGTTLDVSVRFLQVVARSVGELTPPLDTWPDSGEPQFQVVESLRVGNDIIDTWQEAIERTIALDESTLGSLASGACHHEFVMDASRIAEPVRAAEGKFVGALVRERQRVEGLVELSAEAVADGLFRVTVRILNQTPLENAGSKSREEALLHALVSTHTVLVVRDGEFVSLIDPPEPYGDLATACRNVGTYPVLVGVDGERDTMLSAPIILYDYPQVAPQSPGDLFDSTEIDEILTLRIMTLTDQEKQAVAAVDERARAVLDRTEALARDQLLGLHGVMRETRPFSEERDHV
jgi:hypothetical protein